MTLASACLFSFFFGSSAPAQKPARNSSIPSSRIRPETVLLLADFVEWSSLPGGPPRSQFGVCVIGKDPFGARLDSAVLGQVISGRRPFLARTSRPEEIVGCNILFISSSEQKHLSRILAAADVERCLTISDIHNFARKGGMVELLPENKGPHFLINLDAAERAQLKFSSRLLAISQLLPVPSQLGKN